MPEQKIYGPETPGYAQLNAAQEAVASKPKGVHKPKRGKRSKSREQEPKPQ